MRTTTFPAAHRIRRSRSAPPSRRTVRLERYVSFLHQSMTRHPQPTDRSNHSTWREMQLSRQFF